MPTHIFGKFAPVAPQEGRLPLPVDEDMSKLMQKNPQTKAWPGLIDAVQAANSKAIQKRNYKLLSDTLKNQPKAGELDNVRAFIADKITEKKPETMEHLQTILNR